MLQPDLAVDDAVPAQDYLRVPAATSEQAAAQAAFAVRLSAYSQNRAGGSELTQGYSLATLLPPTRELGLRLRLGLGLGWVRLNTASLRYRSHQGVRDTLSPSYTGQSETTV